MIYEVWYEEDGRESGRVMDSIAGRVGAWSAVLEYTQKRDDEHGLIDSSTVVCVAEEGSEYVERYSVRAEVSVNYHADRMVGP